MLGICFVFFFQAEDGIRYLVRSRGLGDVYKRQVERIFTLNDERWIVADKKYDQPEKSDESQKTQDAVSYTHLTLPTSDLV